MRLISGVFFLGLSILIHFGARHEGNIVTFSTLPKPEVALLASGEFTLLTSDFFVIKAAIFSSGLKQANSQKVLWLRKALYLATYLDPEYFEPYWMTGVILPWQGEVKGAEKILLRGIKYLKRRWEIPFYLGFIKFYFCQDPVKAAHYFMIASKRPRAPSYLTLLASRLAAKGGKTSTAIFFLEEQLKMTKDKGLKKRLNKRIKALKIIANLEKAVRTYKRTYGIFPSTLEQLVKAHIISDIPNDPYGGTFYITKKGTIWTTSKLR